MKLFRRKKTIDLDALRYPHRPFNGAVLPMHMIRDRIGKKKVLPETLKYGRRFFLHKLKDGNYLVHRIGKARAKVATYIYRDEMIRRSVVDI
jgi:hypothetical protein